jgi:hypothetical protein
VTEAEAAAEVLEPPAAAPGAETVAEEPGPVAAPEAEIPAEAEPAATEEPAPTDEEVSLEAILEDLKRREGRTE